MKHQTIRTEKEFLDQIDCNFPYTNADLRTKLINEAFEISDNSVFGVVHELARVPKSKHFNSDLLLSILNEINDRLNHPLKEIIFDTASKMVNKNDLSVDEAVHYLNRIENFRGQWNALNIIYFSCDDINGKLETRYNEIVENWKK
jgi:hypothetical protein